MSSRELNEFSRHELHLFLKGYPGDWRGDTDESRGLPEPPAKPLPPHTRIFDLPPFDAVQSLSVREAVASRRSVTKFGPEPVTAAELSYLLWAAQGITGPFRAAPSAGARYPLETYLSLQRVPGFNRGLYRYLPATHRLALLQEAPLLSASLQTACYGNPAVTEAAVVFLWAAVPARTEWRYAYLAPRLIALEAGHICQNLYLAAASCGLAACALAAYHQPNVDRLLEVDGETEFAVYLAAEGRGV